MQLGLCTRVFITMYGIHPDHIYIYILGLAYIYINYIYIYIYSMLICLFACLVNDATYVQICANECKCILRCT